MRVSSYHLTQPLLRTRKTLLPPARDLLLCLALLGMGCAQSGNGPAASITEQEISIGSARHAVWIDLDGDHDLDLAVAATNQLVRLFRNDGAARLTEVEDAIEAPLLRGSGFRLAAGDIDRDGRADLVVCGELDQSKNPVQGCRLLANRSLPGAIRFVELPRVGLPKKTVDPALPLLVDYDGDNDLDLLLFATADHAHHSILRNDLDEGVVTFAALQPSTLRGSDVHDVATMDQNGLGTEIFVAHNSGRDELLVFDRAKDRFVNQAEERGLLPPRGAGPAVALAAGDLDGNGSVDLFVARSDASPSLYLRQPDGTFQDAASAAGLGGIDKGVELAIIEDFNRDGALDLMLATHAGQARLLQGERSRTTRVPRFTQPEKGGTFDIPRKATVIALARVPEECDFALELVVTSLSAESGALIRFADHSAEKTLQAVRGGPPVRALFSGACVNGSDGNDTLESDVRSSVLRGGEGDDTLIARSGVTVLRGGPGRDRFEVTGYAIIRLPPEDIVAGETIVCDPRNPVFIDTPLTRQELVRAGVRFEGCFRDNDCTTEDAHVSPIVEEEEDHHCDGPGTNVAIGDVRADSVRNANVQLTDFATLTDKAATKIVPFYDGPGVGTCHKDSDCYKLGLDFCETPYSMLPIPIGFGGTICLDPLPTETGQCYPRGCEGAVVESICDDPYFSRNRFEEISGQLTFSGERFVIPLVFWLPRSSATDAAGNCSVSNTTAAPSLAQWHQAVAAAMDGVNRTYGKWGIVFDYRINTFAVSQSGAFADDTNPCRTNIVFAESDPAKQYDPNAPNRVVDLVTAFPTKYVDGQINAYLTDGGSMGIGESSSFAWNGGYRNFILLHGSAGAAAHELGHALTLGHPYDNNLATSGTSAIAESRNSWTYRPFPEQPTKGLQLCVFDNECDGVDADPGKCRVAPGLATGFCQNLKRDCATSGDRVCDTPWDSRPCFPGEGKHLYGERCETNDDCIVKGGWVGDSGLWKCGINKHCFRYECTDPSDCASGFCVAGRCASTFFTDAPTCCHVHADLATGKLHNKCWEKTFPGGISVAVPGVGVTDASWPSNRTSMTYHPGTAGVPGMFTKGQRDAVVCRIGYETRYGTIQRQQNAVGQPCSLLPGVTKFGYGDFGEDRLVSHGACASGVCSVKTKVGNGPKMAFAQATCVASTCSDGVAGANEADKDCGGVCPTKCSNGALCRSGSDCVSGVCERNKCQPSCSDAEKDGTELGVDEGGTGLEPLCGGRSNGETCRFGSDCGNNLSCIGASNCVDSSDCAGNGTGLFDSACTTDAECPGKQCVSKFESHCGVTTCTKNDDCVSKKCDTNQGLCFCDRASHCPSDTCPIQYGACTKECVDGRCLGLCKFFISGGSGSP